MGLVSGPRIRLEPGTRHVLAWCTECPPWRALTADRGRANLEAAAHLERVHGDSLEAAEYRRRARDTR